MKEIKLEDLKHCYVYRSGRDIRCIDFIHPQTGLTLYGKTADQISADYPGENVRLISYEDFVKEQIEGQENDPITWTEISEEVYTERMECLPPICHTSRGFMLGEPFSHIAGAPTFDAFRVQDGKFYASDRALTVKQFNKLIYARI